VLFIEDITDRVRVERQLATQVQRLRALRTIDQAITASLDLGVTLEVFLEQVLTQLQADGAIVLLLNQPLHRLEYAAGRGFHTTAVRNARVPAVRNARVPVGQGFAGRAAHERRMVHIPNLSEAGGDLAQALQLEQERFTSYFGVPLIAKGQVKGVLEVYHRRPFEPDSDWLEFLISLAGQAAIAVDGAQLFDSLQRSHDDLAIAYDATIEGWSRAMDLRDHETEGHTKRVTDLVVRLALAAGLDNEALGHVRRGALLHDIGKLGIPDQVLFKPGPLDADEWALMRRHPQLAFDMLAAIPYLRPALDIPYCHHEKWDGSGYPRGLRQEQIPVAARLFAVVDVWDALRSNRPYRSAWPDERVLEHLKAESGRHFDPQVVTLFLESCDSVPRGVTRRGVRRAFGLGCERRIQTNGWRRAQACRRLGPSHTKGCAAEIETGVSGRHPACIGGDRLTVDVARLVGDQVEREVGDVDRFERAWHCVVEHLQPGRPRRIHLGRVDAGHDIGLDAARADRIAPDALLRVDPGGAAGQSDQPVF